MLDFIPALLGLIVLLLVMIGITLARIEGRLAFLSTLAKLFVNTNYGKVSSPDVMKATTFLVARCLKAVGEWIAPYMSSTEYERFKLELQEQMEKVIMGGGDRV